MRLACLNLRNFRCFAEEVIEFQNFTALVGQNNSGKSSILHAISVLYDSTGTRSALSETDVFVHSGKDPLELIYTFEGLSEEEVKTFGHYARSGLLKFVIRASKSEDGSLHVESHGIRHGLKDFAPFFAATKAGEKRPIYEALRNGGLNLPAWTNQEAASHALHQYENEHTERLSEIESEESAYGVAGPASKLRSHLDWMYVPAVKDVSDENS